MPTLTEALHSADSRPHTATLISTRRLTSASAAEDVRQLEFCVEGAEVGLRLGQCVRVYAPGRFGQRHTERLYSVADLRRTDDGQTRFTLLVRRCSYLDPFNGERYAGTASNYLCDLAPGSHIALSGPYGHPFAVPEDRDADLLMVGMGTGIAPFRGLVRRIYEDLGAWRGRVRLFHGARTGLELLYQNDEAADFGLYYDQPTFKAFQALSPRPAFDEPPALGDALRQHAREVWDMLGAPRTQLYIAGPQLLLTRVEAALTDMAGSAEAWADCRDTLKAEGRWHEVLY